MDQQTIRVRRGNVILSVPAIDKDSYLAKGFDVIGDHNKVLEAAISNDVPTLQSQVRTLLAENKALKEQLAKKTTPTPKKAQESASKPATAANKKK